MTDELIVMLDLEQLDGLVIQAFGAGNVPRNSSKVGKSPAKSPSRADLHDVLMVLLNLSTPTKVEGGLQRAGVFTLIKDSNAQKARLKY